MAERHALERTDFWADRPGRALKWALTILAVAGALLALGSGRYESQEAHAAELRQLASDYKTADEKMVQAFRSELKDFESRLNGQVDRIVSVLQNKGDPSPPRASQGAQR